MASLSAVEQVRLSTQALRDALASAYGTDERTIELNRKGLLAAEQKVRLLAKLREPIPSSILAVLVFMIMWLSYATIGQKVPIEEAIGNFLLAMVQPHRIWANAVLGAGGPEARLHAGAAFASWLLILSMFFRFQWMIVLDVSAGRVESHSGKIVSFEQEGTRRGEPDGINHFYFRLQNDMVFEVEPEPYEALDTGGVYEVFYLARSRQIVSIVPLSQRMVMPEPLKPITHL